MDHQVGPLAAAARSTEPREDGMPEETAHPPAAFYDDLAASYDRIYPDWEASSRQQGDTLHAVIAAQRGPGPHRILDCAVGIGTQLLGLAANGHRLAGSDISAGAVGRAQAECRQRGVQAGLAVADMRALPFPDSAFDVVVCADNALPHLLTAADVTRALGEMVRVAGPGGLVVVTTRDYDQARKDHPSTTPLSRSQGSDGSTMVTFQLWDWWPDGEHYDLRHFQVTGRDEHWRVAQRQTAYWALTRAQLSGLACQAGLAAPEWRGPDQTGFFQPLLVAHAPR
jgi:glycine/sarcosine N-methyltransferase